MVDSAIKVTRKQLAEFLPSHELIKAFEKLLEVAGAAPGGIDALTRLIEDASLVADSSAAAQSATAFELSRMASALEILALAPVPQATRPAEEAIFCPSCSGLREELASLSRRVSDIESR